MKKENNTKYCSIGPFSNELEFCLEGVNAKYLISLNQLPLVGEVNKDDIVELNVSMKESVECLNNSLENLVIGVGSRAMQEGGRIYGGSFLLKDISDIIPASYMTTALSKECGRGFLNIASQQVVIGIKDEKIGWKIYNTMRHLNPILLAVSASSPYELANDKETLIDTGLQSIRPRQYTEICKKFPNDILTINPEISSIDEFYSHIKKISGEIKNYLADGRLDADWKELKKIRKNDKGEDKTFFPFNNLDDSQIFWFLRPRPSHETISKDGDCVMSLEFRTPDLPISISDMKSLNGYVIGIANYIANNGGEEILNDLELKNNVVIYNDMLNTGIHGLNHKYGGGSIKDAVSKLRGYAIKGLEAASENLEIERMDKYLHGILTDGSAADKMRREGLKTAEEARDYLSKSLGGY